MSVAAGEGLYELFKDLGVDRVVSGGQSMNPSTENLYNAIMAVPAKVVLSAISRRTTPPEPSWSIQNGGSPMKLMVLDGNSIVNRAYYGVGKARLLTTRQGLHTNAIYGFVTMLQKLLDQEKPDAVCAAFDRREPKPSHR